MMCVRSRFLSLAAAAVTAVILFPPSMASAQAQQSGQYIVSFVRGTPHGAREAAVRRAGGQVRFNYDIVDGTAIFVPNANALNALQQDPSVQGIVPDRPIFAFQNQAAAGKGKPGGGGSGGGSSQVVPEGVKRVGPATSSSHGSGIGVAIVDTGIDFAQSDLAVASASHSGFGGSCQDDNGHGTHVSGIVAALDNMAGVVGVAPNATLYCVKVLDAGGNGSDAVVIDGLNWVSNNAALVTPPIRVVNMSLGREGTLNDNALLRAAIQNLYSQGIVVVVAAGNDGNLQVNQQVPATYPEVFAIASTTAKGGTSACNRFPISIAADTASYFTTDGAFDSSTRIGVTMSAPGEDQEDVSRGCFISSVGILSTRLGGGTTRMSGTSMASPHAAGVVARILQTGTVAPATDGVGVEAVRSYIRTVGRDKYWIAPYGSPSSSWTDDGEPEGIIQAP